MDSSRAPTSIFEMLTHPNPTVEHREPKNKKNTTNKDYHWPRQLKRWSDFDDLKILEPSFNGLLKEVLHQSRGLPDYPRVHPKNCVVRDERDTERLVDKWTEPIVTAALEPIEKQLNAAIWYPGTSPDKEETEVPSYEEAKTRLQPQRKTADYGLKKKTHSLDRLRPDSGSSLPQSRTLGNNSSPDTQAPERFVKEYKPASKWTSQKIAERELLKENGEWKKGMINDNYAMPVRQAYSYCVKHMCRYGCILTCQEAFIFRVQPREEAPALEEQNKRLLRKGLATNGLMEYISIPWDNHRVGPTRDHRTWTVNLALWFMHILAGNGYEVRWKYIPLDDEYSLILKPGSGESTSEADGGASSDQNRPTGHPIAMEEEEERGESGSKGSISRESTITVAIESPVHFGMNPFRKRKRDGEEEELNEDEDEEEDSEEEKEKRGYNLSFCKRSFRGK